MCKLLFVIQNSFVLVLMYVAVCLIWVAGLIATPRLGKDIDKILWEMEKIFKS